jgi:N-acetylmuramoyl-L-alanine amidase
MAYTAPIQIMPSEPPRTTAVDRVHGQAYQSVSTHYIIDRAGNVASSTPENRTANHALGNNVGTIGIELVHNGDGKEAFADTQIDALINLIRSIRTRYDIPTENIKSHAEVDKRTFECGGQTVRARMDPGANFPWSKLRAALTSTSPMEP